MQTQGLTVKKSKLKESKPKETKLTNGKFSIPFRSNKVVKPNYQKKKKKYQKKKQDQKNSSLVTKDNTIKSGNKKKKSDGKCYNYLKKGYFTRNCLKPPKN